MTLLLFLLLNQDLAEKRSKIKKKMKNPAASSGVSGNIIFTPQAAGNYTH